MEDTTSALLRMKVTTLNAYIKKEVWISGLNYQLRKIVKTLQNILESYENEIDKREVYLIWKI